VSVHQADNRHRILKLVRKIWIDDYLKHSLDNLARLELGLEENPDAVSRPWDLIVQQPNRAPRPLPPGQAMGSIFNELGQALLILGAPGAGKTTLLLELARDLLGRAEQDTNGRGQKPRRSFICNRYRCSGRVADWLGSLGYPSFLKDS
jgi:predicted NACHT family NTPase